MLAYSLNSRPSLASSPLPRCSFVLRPLSPQPIFGAYSPLACPPRRATRHSPIPHPLCFLTLAHSFAAENLTIPFISRNSALFPAKHPGGGWGRRAFGRIFGEERKSFRMRTCKNVSKQRTSTPFRMNTYRKRGEGEVPFSLPLGPSRSLR